MRPHSYSVASPIPAEIHLAPISIQTNPTALELEAPMSFKNYILSRRAGQSPSGLLTHDLRRDFKRLPDVESLDQLRGYLHTRFACSEAIEAARTVWRGYVDAQKRKTISSATMAHGPQPSGATPSATSNHRE